MYYSSFDKTFLLIKIIINPNNSCTINEDGNYKSFDLDKKLSSYNSVLVKINPYSRRMSQDSFVVHLVAVVLTKIILKFVEVG